MLFVDQVVAFEHEPGQRHERLQKLRLGRKRHSDLRLRKRTGTAEAEAKPAEIR